MSVSAKRDFGMELILDLYGCDPDIIRDGEKIRLFAGRLCRRIRMKAYGKPIVEHFGHKNPITSGYSLVQLIETSCIGAHFSEETNCAYLNIFSCKSFDAADAVAYCAKYFKASRARRRLVRRK